MSEPSLVVRIAANLQELRRSLEEGRTQIATTTAGMTKLASSFSGDKLVRETQNVIGALGGVQNAASLTDREKQRVNRTVTEMIAKYQALGQEAPKALTDIAAATQRAQQPMISLSGVLQGMVAGATAAVTSRIMNLGSELAAFGAESLARGAQLEALSGSFARLSGGAEAAHATLNAMRRGTSGLTDDMALMQAGNKAMLLGLGLTSQQMGDLAKTATTLGRAMGQDATKSLDDLITALGRSSPLILDNLGLSVKVGEANEQYAAALGKTVEQLTDAEKKQAFMNAAMEAARLKVAELGEVHLTATEHVGKLWTAFRNLADAGGNLATQNWLVDSSLRNLTDGVELLSIALRDGATAAYAHRAGLSDLEVPVVKQTDAFRRLVPQVNLAVMSEDALFAAMQGTADELRQATERVEAHAAAVKGANVVWGEAGNIVRFQIAGIINPDLISFETNTGNAAQVMAYLADELARARGEATSFSSELPRLENTMRQTFDVGFKATVTSAMDHSRSFFDQVFGGADQLGQSVSSIFSAAFTGGGGALGAVKAFATETLATLLSMIPGLPPWVAAFAGPIIEMLGRLTGKVKEFFKTLFGGPSSGELNDRNLVAEWEDQVISSSDAAMSETERWRQVVVAVTEAYLRNGLTAEQAARDVERLWASSRAGGEETWRVIDEVNRNMNRAGQTAVDAVNRVGQALDGLPDVVDISIRGNYSGPDPGNRAGYASGTMGAHGTWFRDFGRGTATVLHGREAVVTPAQAPAFAASVMGGDPELKRLLRELPRKLKLAIVEAGAMA